MTEPGPGSADRAASGSVGLTRYGAGRWNAGRAPEVGGRVVVRRHLRGGETSHLYTDVIGHVVALEPELVVRRDSGEAASEEVVIPAADIAVLKVIPPRVVRNRDIRAREFAGALAWPGTEYALVDGWFCRAGDDWSYRAGSAVPVQPWASTEELDGVRDWYAARGLPLRLVDVDRLVDLSRLALDGTPVDPVRVTAGRELLLCTALTEVLSGLGVARRAEVHLVEEPADDWLALYHATAELDPERVRPAMLATAALDTGGLDTGALDTGQAADTPIAGGHVVFARLEIEGALAAITRGAVTAGPDGVPRLAVSCVQTDERYRRQGLAEVVTGALAEWAIGLGAEECHLHVFADNAAGRGLWTTMGFEPHHTLRHVRID